MDKSEHFSLFIARKNLLTGTDGFTFQEQYQDGFPSSWLIHLLLTLTVSVVKLNMQGLWENVLDLTLPDPLRAEALKGCPPG